MSDDIVTPMHLKTIEKYMAMQVDAYDKTSESVSKLAESVNELVVAEKVRQERDERVQKQIQTLQNSIDSNIDGIRWSSKMSKWIDNYIMKIAAPFVITAIILLIVANTFDFTKLVGK